MHWSLGAAAALVLLVLVALTLLQLDLRERLHAAVMEAGVAATYRSRRGTGLRDEDATGVRPRPVRAYAVTVTSNAPVGDGDMRSRGPITCSTSHGGGSVTRDGALTLGGCRRLVLSDRDGGGDGAELLAAAAAQRVSHVMLAGVVARVHASGTDPKSRSVVLCPLDAVRAAEQGCAAAVRGPFAREDATQARTRLAGAEGRTYALAW